MKFSADMESITWREGRSVRLDTIIAVRPGKTTPNLERKYAAKVPDSHCFSIFVRRNKKTIDLEAETHLSRDMWVKYLRILADEAQSAADLGSG